MVRVVNNTLGVSEETGNEEEKKGSEIREQRFVKLWAISYLFHRKLI